MVKVPVYAFIAVMLLLCAAALALVEKYALAVVAFGAYLAALAMLVSKIHESGRR